MTNYMKLPQTHQPSTIRPPFQTQKTVISHAFLEAPSLTGPHGFAAPHAFNDAVQGSPSDEKPGFSV